MPDRAAIVTGASSGIGLAIAHMLGEEGHGLTVAARRPDKLAAAAEELRGAGYEVEEVAGNMADEDDDQARRRRPPRALRPPRRARQQRRRRRRRAAGDTRPSASTSSSPSTCARSSSSTASALDAAARRRAPSTATRSWSTPPRSPASPASRWLSVYSATKAGVIGYTQAMNKELNGDGIKSVALCPGFVDTPMTEFVREHVAGRGHDPRRGHRGGRPLRAADLARTA